MARSFASPSTSPSPSRLRSRALGGSRGCRCPLSLKGRRLDGTTGGRRRRRLFESSSANAAASVTALATKQWRRSPLRSYNVRALSFDGERLVRHATFTHDV